MRYISRPVVVSVADTNSPLPTFITWASLLLGLMASTKVRQPWVRVRVRVRVRVSVRVRDRVRVRARVRVCLENGSEEKKPCYRDHK